MNLKFKNKANGLKLIAHKKVSTEILKCIKSFEYTFDNTTFKNKLENVLSKNKRLYFP